MPSKAEHYRQTLALLDEMLAHGDLSAEEFRAQRAPIVTEFVKTPEGKRWSARRRLDRQLAADEIDLDSYVIEVERLEAKARSDARTAPILLVLTLVVVGVIIALVATVVASRAHGGGEMAAIGSCQDAVIEKYQIPVSSTEPASADKISDIEYRVTATFISTRGVRMAYECHTSLMGSLWHARIEKAYPFR